MKNKTYRSISQREVMASVRKPFQLNQKAGVYRDKRRASRQAEKIQTRRGEW